MDKILVPIDFSQSSSNALHYALHLFGSSAEFVLLHTYEARSSGAFYMKNIDRVLEEDAAREMESLIRKIKKEHSDVTLTSKVVKGDSVPVITSVCNTGDYDFIVMGTSGASGLKKVFIGSVAGGVISKTKVPVLVVPASYSFEPVGEIIFAVGGASYQNKEILNPLHELAEICNAQINALHISEKEEPDMSEQLAPILDLSPKVTYLHESGDVNKNLNEHIVQSKANLLCMVRTKKGFLGKIFNESATMKQTFNSPVPLLVLPDVG